MASNSRDFYDMLQIKRCATDEEVSNNYKKLALKHHPLKNPDNMKIHLEKFH
jgi:molecular chaperone DnaJ